MTAVRAEVTRQLEAVGITNLEDLAKQVAALLGRGAETAKRPPKKAPAKKAPAKKAAGRRRPPAKKAPAKKAAAKKAPAKKAAAKKAPAKKAAATTALRPHAAAPPGTGGVGRLTPPARQRLDQALVARRLADSRPQAVELIARGVVLVSGSLADKPARLVSPAEPIELLGDPPALRQPRRREAPAPPSTGSTSTRPGVAGPRRRGLDRRVHRLPAPGRRRPRGRRRRRARPAPSRGCAAIPGSTTLERLDIRDVTLDTVGGAPGRPGRGRPVVHLGHPGRARPDRRGGRRRARRWWSW